MKILLRKKDVKYTESKVVKKYMYSLSLKSFLSKTCFNAIISPNFWVWKLCGKAQFKRKETLQNLCTRKLGEITVFFAVHTITLLFFF